MLSPFSDDLDFQTLADDGVWLHLKHPVTNALLFAEPGKPMRVKVIGGDGDKFERVRSQWHARRFEMITTKAADGATVDPDQDRAIDLDFLTSCIVTWENLYNQDGSEFPYTPEHARDLLRRRKWIFEQINRFVVQRVNFQKRPAAE